MKYIQDNIQSNDCVFYHNFKSNLYNTNYHALSWNVFNKTDMKLFNLLSSKLYSSRLKF